MELAPILDAYQRAHGVKARAYAEEAIPKWESGETRMSGMVASRLFRLLPPFMPLEAKYRLTRDLWGHVGPSSKKRVRVGRNAGVDEVLDVVRAHMSDVVVHYIIPPALERRFNWLAADDVQLKQLLLNRLLDEEQDLVVRGVRAEFPVLQRHLSGLGGGYTQRLVHKVSVAKHEIELAFDHSIEGVRVEVPVPAQAIASEVSIRWWVAIGALLLLSFVIVWLNAD